MFVVLYPGRALKGEANWVQLGRPIVAGRKMGLCSILS